MMIRTLLLAAILVAVVLGQLPVDQAEWFSWRMGQGPFCDSQCSPEGNWLLRRDWWNLESINEEQYLWFADGSFNFWNDQSSLGGRSCGEVVNNLVVGETSQSESNLLSCQPGIIYFFQYQVSYDHGDGKIEESLYSTYSFVPSSSSWSEFIRDYLDVTVAVRRTQPWDLIRMVPSTIGEPISKQYTNAIAFRQEFVANYERNCCTFVGSTLPIYDAIKCDFADFDSDQDSDDFAYPTYWFCDYILGTYDEVDIDLDCGDSDDDEPCNRMLVRTDTRRQMLAGDKLRAVMYGARAGGKAEKITRGDYNNKMREMNVARGTYGYAAQPIPGFGGVFDGSTDPIDFSPNFWQVYWDEAVFYYVPYTSSITAPYCGYKTKDYHTIGKPMPNYD